MKRKFTYFLALVVGSFLLISCGANRKNPIARGYHNTTTLFNWYYNGEIEWKTGVRTINEGFRVPAETYIPLLYFGDERTASGSFGNFDAAIEKAETAIMKHPGSRWEDNCRFLIGRSKFYKRNYYEAIQNFEYILKMYKKSRITDDVQFWLALTNYRIERSQQAEKILEEKLKGKKVRKKREGMIAMLKAEMLMDKEDYKGVIKTLERNKGKYKGRLSRARVYFLLGQLYADEGKLSKAYENYKKVTRINTDYNLVFAAKMRSLRLLIEQQGGVDETQQIQRALKKMIRDEKNIDYRDQIYYEMAMLDLKKSNYKGALENLRKSTAANTIDTRQKAVSYYRSGQIYFYNLYDFTNAQAYFDSAATFIEKDEPEYFEITSIGATLKDYINYKHTIHYQDSMVWLASLSPEKIEKQIDKIIQQEKQAERNRLNKENEGRYKPNDPNIVDPNRRNNKNTGSGFYFDKPDIVSTGRLEFQAIWGNRKIEDNWRRKNKSMVVATIEETDAAEVDSSLLLAYGDKAKYYKDIPKNEDQVAESNEEIKDAMFNLGQLFSQKLDQPDSALKVFNKLIKRYPGSEQSLKAKFAMFTMYKKKDPYLAGDYGDEVCKDAPGSIYCKLVRNQDVGEELNESQMAFESAYTALYTTYNNKDYETAISFSNFLLDRYAKNPEIPTVLYLRGMSFGRIGKSDSLKNIFTSIVNNFPEAEVTPIAQRTLAKMGIKNEGPIGPRDPSDVENPEEVTSYDNPKFKDFLAKPKANEKVFVVMLIDKNTVSSNDLKVALSTFNNDYFKSDKLSTSIFFYKQEKHLAYVSQFESLTDAFNYMKIALQDKKIQAFLTKPDDAMLFITPHNFKTAYGKKRFDDYSLFFQQIILPTM